MELTLDKVKDCVSAMPPDMKRTLELMCDCWYKMALAKGMNEHDGCVETLNNLGVEMRKFDKTKNVTR